MRDTTAGADATPRRINPRFSAAFDAARSGRPRWHDGCPWRQAPKGRRSGEPEMSARVVELATYRAQRAPKTVVTSIGAAVHATPTATMRASADSASAALAVMAAACRAWAENLRQVGTGARAITAR